MEAPYRQPTSLEEVRTLWIGGLKHGVDERFLYECFALTGEVHSVRLIHNRITGSPEGYGFIEFISHEAAQKALQSYNGARMPGTEHRFRLNWASFGCGETRPHEGANHSNGPYCSVRQTRISAADPKIPYGSHLHDGDAKGKEAVIPSVGKINRKIVCDSSERRPHAGPDHSNGGVCSTTPLRISAAIPNTSSGAQLQNGAAKAMYPAAAYTISQVQTSLPDSNLAKTTIFIGNLDPNATEEELRQICVQFGDLIRVKIPVGKGCGIVEFASMASAKEAIQRLHGTVIGQQVVRLSWGRSPASKEVEGATGMASAAGSHVPGMKQNKVYDLVNLPHIDKGVKVVTDPDTAGSKGYEFIKSAAENEKICAVTETNGACCSTRPMQISAAIPKASSGSQHQDGAAKGNDLLFWRSQCNTIAVAVMDL
ncbi:polyadenylate-binding protein RBP47B'-like [Lolium rigidum]|uniref:polyadenylate-binding protein RBP47B'-like n=1 Tax=Lolium rigidum TaxID=89674 RepID=UPI001F5C550F|nr:polyadenylate-binding protein RBP47B'-like [Lolium rigidum]